MQELPDIESISSAFGEAEKDTYTEYLKRIQEDYLSRCKYLDFLSNVGVAFSANAANTSTVLICCELGMSWSAAASVGFGFGLIPAAYYFNKAGINFSGGLEVRDLGSGVTAVGLAIGAGTIAWNAAGEKRILIKYAEDGQRESSKLIAEYEVKAPAYNDFLEGFKSVVGNSSNLIVIGIVGFLIWKFTRR